MFIPRLNTSRTILVITFLFVTFFTVFSVYPAEKIPGESDSTRESVGLSKEKKDNYNILPGDTIRIAIYNDKELSEGIERIVGENGIITIPYVDVKVSVKGLCVEDCKREIRKRLKEEQMYHNPNLDVSISKFGKRRVQITGYVEKPGAVEFEDGKSLPIDEAIAKAGGFSRNKRVARNKVKLTRTDSNGNKVTMLVPVEDIMEGKAEPVYLEPNDIIEVKEKFL